MAKRKRKNAKRQSLITALVVLVIAAGSFCYSYFMQNPTPGTEGVSQPQESEQLQVYFIDVGQGDSSLIVCGEHSVLIDAGEAEYANDVIRQIQDLGIERLDCIVSTHRPSVLSMCQRIYRVVDRKITELDRAGETGNSFYK